MGGRAIAGRGKVELAGLGFVQRNQLLDIAHAQVRAHHQHVGQIAHVNNGREAGAWVVVDGLVQRLVDGQRARGAEHQRVAIGLGAGYGIGTDIAAGTSLVFHDHALAQLFGQLGGQNAGHGVCGPARRKGHDKHDGALGEFLGSHSAQGHSQAQGGTGHHASAHEQTTIHTHGLSPW